MIVLHNTKKGNNARVAKAICNYFDCNSVAAEDNPDISIYDTIFLVVPNHGDEELPKIMEKYLLDLKVRNKKYLVCELGNYFGLEYHGCKKIVFSLLDSLGWSRISDVSIDSFPDICFDDLYIWFESLENRWFK